MRLPDLQRFIKVAPAELSESLFLQTPESDPLNKEPIIKIRDLNSLYIEAGDTFDVSYEKGLFLDIFPFIPLSERAPVLGEKLCKGISTSYSILHARHYYSLRSFAEFFYFGAKNIIYRSIWGILCLFYKKDTYLSNVLINNGYGIMHRNDSVFPFRKSPSKGKHSWLRPIRMPI